MTGSGNGSSSFIQGNSTYIIGCSEAIAAVFLRKRFLKMVCNVATKNHCCGVPKAINYKINIFSSYLADCLEEKQRKTVGGQM